MNLFTDTQNRIHSIALIHNIMYKSKNLGSVDFEEYVQDLASILVRSLAVDREKIRLHIDAIDVRLDINRAIPCGLIINEIVSNSIKHAFPGERTGDVRISFSGEDPDRYTLLVRDNGIGIDGNIDLDRTDSIGLTIVRDLTLQLKGTLGIHNDNGTEIRVEFPKQRNPAE
jgi:two-component sensor histidine kinase